MGHERTGFPHAGNLARTAVVLLVLPTLAGPTMPTWAGDGDALRAAGADDRVAVILAPRQRAVLSAEVSARVVAINRELGEQFDRDDVLVRLDDLTFRVAAQVAAAQFQAAETELAHIRELTEAQTRKRRAEAILAAAQANLAATQRLYDDNHASLVDLANAQRDAATAEAERELVVAAAARELVQAQRDVVIARGKNDLAADDLEACTLAAPYAGRVARLLINEHELVDRGTPMIEVVDDRVLLAKFLLPSSLFRAVRVGQELKLTVSETRETVKVKISHIAAVLDPASVTFEVYAEIDNADGNLRAGMNGWLRLAELGTQ